MRILGVVVLVLTLMGTAVLAEDGDTFRSATAGFEVTKPTDWQYLTAEENQENLSRIELSDEELRAALLKYATVPLVATTKHPEPFDDLNPSFRVNMRPLGELAALPATEVLGAFLPQFEQLFEEFELAEGPVETEVSGLPAAYVRMNYTLRTGDDLTFPTCSELWIVPRGEFFFMIGAGTRQDEATGTRKEIHDILKSVKIEH
ncbi:MAG: hypothetical protein KDA27_27745 [Candidatus Eisenbacteria bacterium]|uniref:DUF1795 domain-containing protein n=1 Tax=Eiseniibacteriota bacterium TaxID=2212470 RepID=A0A956SGW1_UNCEI|nr:hypothetical protein [Candidatus Eisenbacteria bacterium]MCB9465122.1 hypothetical protein [Candidatus Eisenbacteria bacterium]